MQAPALDAPAADWLVYGDALQEAGDPRGALIGLSHAVAEGKIAADVRDAYVKEHARALLTHAAPFLATFSFEWRYCVPIAATMHFTATTGDRDVMLLESPLGEQLRALTIAGDLVNGKVDLAPIMKRVVNKRPPHLTSFSFVDTRARDVSTLVSRDFAPGYNLVSFGSFEPFYPFAEEIHIVAADSHQLELGAIDAPHLRAFTLNSLRFADYGNAGPMPARLVEMEAPKLERYALRLTETYHANIADDEGAYVEVYKRYFEDQRAEWEAEQEDIPEDEREEYYDRSQEGYEGELQAADWRALDDLLAALAAGPLKHLALTGFASSRSVIEAIAEAKLSSLEVLDLSDSELDDTDATWMTSQAVFTKLKRIVVEHTRLTEAGATTLRKIIPEVAWSPGVASYRYIVGSE